MPSLSFSYRVSFLVGSLVLAGACATGTEGDFGDGGGASSGGAATGGATGGDGMGGASTSTGTATGTGTGTGTGGTGGIPFECNPPLHKCDGMCEPNLPETGCYQSTTCDPCPPAPTNGTTQCTDMGACDFQCNPPYLKGATTCDCPTQCCTNADCSGGATCQNGNCVTPCDDNLCIVQCIGMSCLGGMCGANGCMCICI